MTRRISRAKQTIAAADPPFATPPAAQWPARLAAVEHTLYLMFSEGYTAAVGPALQRSALTCEAIRLTRLVHRILPDDGEVAGLLALMLLTDARRPARSLPDGTLVPLAEQDRGLWKAAAIQEGIDLITRTLPRALVGPYQVQAAIAAVHAEAHQAADTHWPRGS
jgi:predicted RNA polymerase sigma factor